MIPPKSRVTLGKKKAVAPPTDAQLDAFLSAATPALPPPESEGRLTALLTAVVTEAFASPADDLFSGEAPAPPQPAPWRGCVVCGGKSSPRAHPAHDICQRCAQYPIQARDRLAAQRAGYISRQHLAARDNAAAWAALTDAERGRWETYATLCARADSGDALSAEDARRLAATRAAYRTPIDDAAAAAWAAGATLDEVAGHYGRDAALALRISPALRRYEETADGLWWANQEMEHGGRQIEIKIAQLGVLLEDLGRKDESDALYTAAAQREPRAPTPMGI